CLRGAPQGGPDRARDRRLRHRQRASHFHRTRGCHAPARRYPQSLRCAGSAGLMFDKLALIGIGLIGSSIARAVKVKGLAKTIAISTRKQETLDEARALDLGDIYTLDAAE